jgi:hypothetical protein
MKTRYLVAAVVLFALMAGSALADTAPVSPLYTKQFGSSLIDYARKVVADDAGNVYVAGSTHGAFGATSQGTLNTNLGGADAFVAKFDAQGSLLWVTQFGSAADDFIEGLALDKDGFLYVAGWTKGDMPVGFHQPAAPGNHNAGGQDAFVAKISAEERFDAAGKIDAGGTIFWIQQFGSAEDDYANSVAIDKSGSIFVAGSTEGSIDKSTDPGGFSNAFLFKFEPFGGALIQKVQFNAGTEPVDTYANAVTVDSVSSMTIETVYVTGLAGGNKNGSLFVAKCNVQCSSAAALTVATLSYSGSENNTDTGRAIVTDKWGNVIVAGSTLGAFDGHPWSGEEDIFVVKFSPTLKKRWSIQYGTASNDAAYGVAVDAYDSILVTGITGLPTGPGLDGKPYLGASDIFLTRIATEDGRKIYTRQIGTAAQDWAYGVTVAPSGYIYLAGATEGAMGTQVSGNTMDAVLIQYDKDGPVPPPVTDFFINGTVREMPTGSPLGVVGITVKDGGGKEVGSYTTDVSGRFNSKVSAEGKYFIYKLKIGYTAQIDPDEVEVSEAAPTATLVSNMLKIVVKTEMSIRKGYSTIRFTKLPAGDRSVNAVFGPYAGNPYVGLIFSFDRPMQYLLLHGHKTVGNLKTMAFGRSYMIYSSKAFTIDTTYWVGPDTPPPATTYQGKVQY